jgi:hypothetical protein
MERAAVDRKARAASLQDELNATAKEIEHGHQRGVAAMAGNQGGGQSGRVSFVAHGRHKLAVMTLSRV